MLAPQKPFYQGDSLHNSYGFRRCCEAVRQAVPIEEVARRYTDLEPLGGRAWFDGRCPLPDHEDKTPSFYIYPPGRFYCYGCGRGGDVVDLEFHCGDYGELWEAMISLAVDYDVELPERSPSWRRKQERQKPVRGGIEAAKIHAAQAATLPEVLRACRARYHRRRRQGARRAAFLGGDRSACGTPCRPHDGEPHEWISATPYHRTSKNAPMTLNPTATGKCHRCHCHLMGA
jgi:DNA primase